MGKFKEGDYIVNTRCKDKTIFKIVLVLSDNYLVDNIETGGRLDLSFKYEHNYTLWSVDMAKPGDILCQDFGDEQHVFIVKSIENGVIKTPLLVDMPNSVFTGQSIFLSGEGDKEAIRPAFNFERIGYIKAMKACGYRLNKNIDLECDEYNKDLAKKLIKSLSNTKKGISLDTLSKIQKTDKLIGHLEDIIQTGDSDELYGNSDKMYIDLSDTLNNIYDIYTSLSGALKKITGLVDNIEKIKKH